MHQIVAFQIRPSWFICFLGWKVKPTPALLNYFGLILLFLQGAGISHGPRALVHLSLEGWRVPGQGSLTIAIRWCSSVLQKWIGSTVPFAEQEFRCVGTHTSTGLDGTGPCQASLISLLGCPAHSLKLQFLFIFLLTVQASQRASEAAPLGQNCTNSLLKFQNLPVGIQKPVMTSGWVAIFRLLH